MHAAAAACLDSASGVATPSTTHGYQLLRQAAGMLDFVAGRVLAALPAGVACLDLDAALVRALSTLALADAQQLTVLRAVAKGNQPALIASLAADTAALYGQAGGQVGSAASGAGQFNSSGKFILWLDSPACWTVVVHDVPAGPDSKSPAHPCTGVVLSVC
jgi:hypothetical protein